MNLHLRLIVTIAALLLLCGCVPVQSSPNALPARPLLPALPSATPIPTNLTSDGGSISLVTWNLGLEDADLETIAAQIADFQGVDLWTFQEVSQFAAQNAQLEEAAEAGESANFEAVQGTSGRNIPLLSVYDADRFSLVDAWELTEINVSGTVRAPLVLHLRENDGGLEFLLVNNHLYRSEEDRRDLQATLLNQWAQEQTLPIVAGGDYNFDYDVPDGPQPPDAGFGNLTAGDVWRWVQPETLLPTQCSDTLPCTYDDILDFIFTAGPARDWPATAQIIVRPNDFPDDTQRSDHRPVGAIFHPPN